MLDLLKKMKNSERGDGQKICRYGEFKFDRLLDENSGVGTTDRLQGPKVLISTSQTTCSFSSLKSWNCSKLVLIVLEVVHTVSLETFIKCKHFKKVRSKVKTGEEVRAVSI